MRVVVRNYPAAAKPVAVSTHTSGMYTHAIAPVLPVWLKIKAMIITNAAMFHSWSALRPQKNMDRAIAS